MEMEKKGFQFYLNGPFDQCHFLETLCFLKSMDSSAQENEKISPESERKFPSRRQELDHRELNKYMEDHKIRELFTQMIAYLVENRCEDHVQGALDFLHKYKSQQ